MNTFDWSFAPKTKKPKWVWFVFMKKLGFAVDDPAGCIAGWEIPAHSQREAVDQAYAWIEEDPELRDLKFDMVSKRLCKCCAPDAYEKFSDELEQEVAS